MTIEINFLIDVPLNVSEEMKGGKLQEPKAVFLVKNGTGEEREITVTLSSWKSTIRSALDELKRIKEGQERVRERSRMISKRKTSGSGRPYSSTEKKQILSQIGRDRERIDQAMEISRRERTVLVRQGNWLLVSSSLCPLKVRVKNVGEDELVSGEPLNGGNAAWRMFVLQEGEDLAFHPNVRFVKEFFVLRRDVFFQNEDKPGEAVKKLDVFRGRVSELVPDELVPVFKRIGEFDFRRPLLPELETLRKEG